MSFNRFCPIVIALLWCGAWHSVNAQEPPEQPKLPETETIRLETKLALLNVGVFDKQGQPVSNLAQADFTVYENGKPQSIAFFKQEDEPISFGLILDRSQSMGDSNKFEQAKAVALAFLRAGNPRNEAFCIAFNEQAGELSDFTTNYDQIASRLSLLKAEGGTAMYDALLLGLEKLQHARHQRRALIIITDGGDQHSKQSLTKLIRRAQQSDVQIYAVGFYSPLEAEAYRDDSATVEMVDGAMVVNPKFVFRALAEETGAETFFPLSAKELEQTVAEIAASLRRQYLLAYYLPEAPAGVYRQITVKVRNPALRIQTRRGFLSDDATELDKNKPLGKHAAALLNPKLKLAEAVAKAEASDDPPPLYRETFDQPGQLWPQTESTRTAKGKYNVSGKTILPALPYRYDDFEASFSINFLTPTESENKDRTQLNLVGRGADLSIAGFSFRLSAEGYYQFAAASAPTQREGNYRLVKVHHGQETVLLTWRKDLTVRPFTKFKIKCTGNKIELFANDFKLTELKDTTHQTGQLGWIFSGGAVQLDDISVKLLKP